MTPLVSSESASTLVAGYVVLRATGTVAGAMLGLRAARDRELAPGAGPWMGAALMPQAGVALGMALVAAQRHPELAAGLLPVVVASTAIFEVSGPILARAALRHAGESGRARPTPEAAPASAGEFME